MVKDIKEEVIKNDVVEQTGVAVINNSDLAIFNVDKQTMFCSLKLDTAEDKKKLYNTLESCDVLLNDIKGQVINIKDVYAEEREIVDDETGEIKTKYRIILFDINGKTYATGSYGIYNSIKKIIAIYGMPTWENGIEVEVTDRPLKDNRRSLTLLLK